VGGAGAVEFVSTMFAGTKETGGTGKEEVNLTMPDVMTSFFGKKEEKPTEVPPEGGEGLFSAIYDWFQS